MIKKHCFSEEWINGFRKEKNFSKINPPILEKMINALSLLQHLVKNDLEFVFKGGTSLILLLDDANRFSVDVDILTTQKRDTIEGIFNTIIEKSHFIKWELDERRSYKPGIPKAHYEFEFNSVFSKQVNTVLLDISPNDILDDIFNTAKLISMREKNRTEPEKNQFKEIQTGIRSFTNFLMIGNFRIDDAINASAKVAYLAMKLKTNEISAITKFANNDISDLAIKMPEWNYLNKLKKLPDKSGYFYWYKIYKLMMDVK